MKRGNNTAPSTDDDQKRKEEDFTPSKHEGIIKEANPKTVYDVVSTKQQPDLLERGTSVNGYVPKAIASASTINSNLHR